MSIFPLSSSQPSAGDLSTAPTDLLDRALDRTLDHLVETSQQGLLTAVDASVPVEQIRVEPAYETGPRAWRVIYAIADADHADPRARPPVERFAITRADSDGQKINAAAIEVLAIELDTLAADPDVHWTAAQQAEAYGAISLTLSSAIGVSGTPRDRLIVQVRVGSVLRPILSAHLRECVGPLFRLLDLAGAQFES